MNTRVQLGADQLRAAGAVASQVDNATFLPRESSADAQHGLALSLDILQTPMNCNHQGVAVNGKAIDLFPAARFRLVSDGSDLVPLDRDLLRNPEGESYWDVTLSPGKVWSEPEDGGWSRAALPFQLSNIFENDTHHGIATFLYNDTGISPVFYQIVTETKAFLCPDNLQAWGWLKATPEPLSPDDCLATCEAYHEEQRDQLPIRPLADWKSDATRAGLDDIDRGFGSESSIVSGLIVDGEIYATPCRTSMGDYPYPRAMKFGIWSATKTAFCSIACLRLAQVIGEDPREARVADLLPEAQNNPVWADVTIGHCLDMATGVGTAAGDDEQAGVFADYQIEDWQSKESEEALRGYTHYHEWFVAPSQHEKNGAAFACSGYPWPAGTVVRYRDQDLYIAGAALDALLKGHRGPDSRIWNMVRDEVYRPARIHHAVNFHTIETDPQKEVPLSDAGLLLSMDNVARLGKLILEGGIIEGQQILAPGLLDQFFNVRTKKGLPTGIETTDGEVHYYGGIWHLPYRSQNGEAFWIPTMKGYGGQLIQLLPNHTIGFRFAYDSYETEERYDMLKLVRLSDAMRAFR